MLETLVTENLKLKKLMWFRCIDINYNKNSSSNTLGISYFPCQQLWIFLCFSFKIICTCKDLLNS